MKVKLSVCGFPLNGYKNIDPSPQVDSKYDGQFDIIYSDFRNLDGILEPAECDEIIVENICEYVFHYQLEKTIAHFVSKLRHGGRIIFNSSDLEQICKLYLNDEIDIAQFNQLVFGRCNNAWSINNSLTARYEVHRILTKLGLSIISQKITQTTFTIVAERI